MVLGGIAFVVVLAPFVIKRERETTELNDDGIVQIDGHSRIEVRWSDISEIGIVTTSDGPFAEDVLFVFKTSDTDGCVVSHEAAERVGLLQELQTQFPDLDNNKIIEAMGCTSDNSFVLWKPSTADP